MPEDLRKLVVRGRGLKQWDIFLLIFVGLVILWGKVLIQNSSGLWRLWSTLASFAAGGLVIVMWALERWPGKPDP
jgi:hypothetical protein